MKWDERSRGRGHDVPRQTGLAVRFASYDLNNIGKRRSVQEVYGRFSLKDKGTFVELDRLASQAQQIGGQ